MAKLARGGVTVQRSDQGWLISPVKIGGEPLRPLGGTPKDEKAGAVLRTAIVENL